MNKRLPSIILTGASGFVGRNLLDSIKNKYKIFAIARRSRLQADVPYHPNIQWIQCDVANWSAVKEVMYYIEKQGGADFIIHLAGYYDFDYKDMPEYKRTNVNGTKNFLELAKYLKIQRFIFSSSLAACSFPAKGEVVDEKSKADANFEYARSKKEGEELLREYSRFFPCSVVRFAAVFSDWCEYAPLYKFLVTWLNKNWNSKILGGKGESAVSYIHTHDLNKLLLAIINKSNTLRRFDIYNASPIGSTSHKELFRLATLYYYGQARKPFFAPKIIAKVGVHVRSFLGEIGIINKPFERPWMIKYIDLKLHVSSEYTQYELSWTPTPRYDISRRLLFVLEKMKVHYNEWIIKNEAALKHPINRPNYLIYEHLVKRKEDLLYNLYDYIFNHDAQNKFVNYKKMGKEEFQSLASNLYHLILASVRSGDKNLMINYIEDIALQRFAEGFESKEICDLLSIAMNIIIEDLSSDKILKKYQQDIYDNISLTIQLAQDEIEDTYENLEEKLSDEKIFKFASIQEKRKREEMIRQLSSFYQENPSG